MPGTDSGGRSVAVTGPGPAPAEGLDRRFQALSDPKRLRVLDLLREGERCVCELTEALDVSQSLLSFHLKTLKEAGLVEDRRDGRWVYYSLATEPLEGLRVFLGALLRKGGRGEDGGRDGDRARGGDSERDGGRPGTGCC